MWPALSAGKGLGPCAHQKPAVLCSRSGCLQANKQTNKALCPGGDRKAVKLRAEPRCLALSLVLKAGGYGGAPERGLQKPGLWSLELRVGSGVHQLSCCGKATQPSQPEFWCPCFIGGEESVALKGTVRTQKIWDTQDVRTSTWHLCGPWNIISAY